MVSGGFDILSHIMETYFSGPDADNVSDDIMEALIAQRHPQSARRHPGPGGLHGPQQPDVGFHDGGEPDHQDGQEVRLPVPTTWSTSSAPTPTATTAAAWRFCTRSTTGTFCKDGLSKFVRFAENVWGIERGGRSDEALAEAGIDAPGVVYSARSACRPPCASSASQIRRS